MQSLDTILLLAECAEWLRMTKRTLLKKVKGRNPVIPSFRISRQEYRFHPRTIIAKLAADSGVSPAVIAASLSLPTNQSTGGGLTHDNPCRETPSRPASDFPRRTQ